MASARADVTGLRSTSRAPSKSAEARIEASRPRAAIRAAFAEVPERVGEMLGAEEQLPLREAGGPHPAQRVGAPLFAGAVLKGRGVLLERVVVATDDRERVAEASVRFAERLLERGSVVDERDRARIRHLFPERAPREQLAAHGGEIACALEDGERAPVARHGALVVALDEAALGRREQERDGLRVVARFEPVVRRCRRKARGGWETPSRASSTPATARWSDARAPSPSRS